MSVTYFVRYDSTAPEAKAFVERYRTRHIPLLLRWPGVTRVTLHSRHPSGDAARRGMEER